MVDENENRDPGAGEPAAGGEAAGPQPATPPQPPPQAPPPRITQPSTPPLPGPPALSGRDRLQFAWQRRGESDYFFDYWTALGWSILTLGIYSFYVFYQLVRRMRDHNQRRLEFLDAALAVGWEEAGRRGLQEELTPSFQRASAHMDVLRRMTGDFRDPVIWLVLSIIVKGIVELVAFVLLDQDLVRHDQAEVGVEYELAVIFGRFGQPVPAPDPSRVKGQNNYVGRVVATIFSFGIYLFWWYYNQMEDPNRHFRANWAQEDALMAAVHGLG